MQPKEGLRTPHPTLTYEVLTGKVPGRFADLEENRKYLEACRSAPRPATSPRTSAFPSPRTRTGVPFPCGRAPTAPEPDAGIVLNRPWRMTDFTYILFPNGKARTNFVGVRFLSFGQGGRSAGGVGRRTGDLRGRRPRGPRGGRGESRELHVARVDEAGGSRVRSFRNKLLSLSFITSIFATIGNC